jgi:hypothetical protein
VQADPAGADLGEDVAGAFGLRDQRALRDFELQRVRREPGPRERRVDRGGEAGVVEL